MNSMRPGSEIDLSIWDWVDESAARRRARFVVLAVDRLFWLITQGLHQPEPVRGSLATRLARFRRRGVARFEPVWVRRPGEALEGPSEVEVRRDLTVNLRATGSRIPLRGSRLTRLKRLDERVLPGFPPPEDFCVAALVTSDGDVEFIAHQQNVALLAALTGWIPRPEDVEQLKGDTHPE